MLFLSLFADIATPPDLDQLCYQAVAEAKKTFPEPAIKDEDLGIKVIVLPSKGQARAEGGFMPNNRFYPASVVKLYYLAYGAHLKSQNRLNLTPEHDRAFKDMIVDSSNDGTGLVLDLVTDTTGGAELPEPAMQQWMRKRQAVNRWLKSLGIADTNACQKTWNEGPYGRERIGYGPNYELRNMATAESSARMMELIAERKIGSQPEQDWMFGYLKRDQIKGDGQTRTFIGKVVPSGWTHYSKAGWAYEVRCDVAYITGPDGQRIVLSIYTDHNVKNLQLLPFLADKVLRGVGVITDPKESWSAPVEDPEE